jgi:hypothetical protein
VVLLYQSFVEKIWRNHVKIVGNLKKKKIAGLLPRETVIRAVYGVRYKLNEKILNGKEF